MTQPTDSRIRDATVLQREVRKVRFRLLGILRTSAYLCDEARRTRATAQRLRAELHRPHAT